MINFSIKYTIAELMQKTLQKRVDPYPVILNRLLSYFVVQLFHF